MSTSTSSSTNSPPKKPSLAILDDYASTAPPHFQHLIPHLSTIDSFPSTLNPSDPTSLQSLIHNLHPYDIISTMRERTPFPASLVSSLPNLKLLLSSGNRNAALDLAEFSRRGIPVTGTKGDRVFRGLDSDHDPVPPEGYSAVNQHAWALLLAICGRVARDHAALASPFSSPSSSPSSSAAWQSGLGISLGGRTLGVVGLGKLGALMARTAAVAFGMKVIAWSENLTQEKADVAAAAAGGFGKGEWEVVSKEELFRRADVVSLHLVLSERTKGVVGTRELGWMKDRAILVNTSRGGLIDEEALIRVVKEGSIGGVALDVFWEEPLPANSPWRSVDEWGKAEVVLSPHMGYVNTFTMNSWYLEQAENLERWLNGQELLNRMN